MNLIEMVLSRLDAMDRCINIGELFTKHFNIICEEGKDSPDFKHHCGELQGWYKSVCKIKMKHTSKEIDDEHMIDWFFTAGRNLEDVIDPSYISKYDMFIKALLNDRELNQPISEILERIL